MQSEVKVGHIKYEKLQGLLIITLAKTERQHQRAILQSLRKVSTSQSNQSPVAVRIMVDFNFQLFSICIHFCQLEYLLLRVSAVYTCHYGNNRCVSH